jgi:predicted enzyme related to lactoylglutathione lyase
MPAPANNTVAWFEIGAPDADAAKAFYGPRLGWSFTPDGAYTLVTTPAPQAHPLGSSTPAATSRRTPFSSSRSQTSPRPPPRPGNWAARSSSRR